MATVFPHCANPILSMASGKRSRWRYTFSTNMIFLKTINLEEHAFLGIFNVALSIYFSFSLAVLFCTPMGAWHNSLS